MPPPLPEFGPAAPGARDAGLDLVRGFAVLGLAFANVPSFASSEYYSIWLGRSEATKGGALVADVALEFFVAGKCVALLAFLLGVGLALQQRRALAAGRNFTHLALRRMVVLLGIGVVHALLLWWGDILVAYAVIGAATVLLVPLPPRTLRRLAAGLILFVVVVMGAAGLLMPTTTFGEDDVFIEQALAVLHETYAGGNPLLIFAVRLVETVISQLSFLMIGPFYLGITLLGFDAVRSGWFPWGGTGPGRWRWIVIAALGVGLSFPNALVSSLAPGSDDAYAALAFAGMPGALGMAALYLVVLLRIAANPAGAWLAPVRWVGRTALSNYLLQSLLAGLVFYGYGLGWYGTLDVYGQLAVSAALVVVCLLWSGVWLLYFRFGPMEMLWRHFAYDRPANEGPRI